MKLTKLNKRMRIYLYLMLFTILLFNPVTKNWFSKNIKGYASCEVCGKSFEYTDHHNIWYRDGGAYFYTCEKCWSELTIDERIDITINGFTKWHASRHLEPTKALRMLVDSIQNGN